MSVARILSIDGGGIRGLLPAILLAKLERELGRPIHELFHMVAGTSTGAVLGLGLTKPQPYTARQMVELYRQVGPRIFHAPKGWRLRTLNGLLGPSYDVRSWEKVLVETFGDLQFADCLSDVLVASYDLERREPAIFKSWRARDELERSALFQPNPRNKNYLIRDIARGSSAAPTYFAPARIQAKAGKIRTLIDGGVYANNPSALAHSAAHLLYPEASSFLFVSLGTGKLSRAYPYEEAKHWGSPQWAMPVIEILGGAIDDTVDYELRSRLMGQPYFRFQIDLLRRDATIPAPSDRMDEISRENIQSLCERGELMLEEQSEQVQRLVRLLAQPMVTREQLI